MDMLNSIEWNLNQVILRHQYRLTSSDLETIDEATQEIKGKLFDHFDNAIDEVQIFGSYQQNLMLSPAFKYPEVYFLIFFKGASFQKAASIYHHKLAKFCSNALSRPVNSSRIYVQLGKFLYGFLPGVYEASYWPNYSLNKKLGWRSPFDASLYEQSTTQEFKDALMLLKIWNAKYGFRIDPIWLEMQLLLGVDSWRPCETVIDYFLERIDWLEVHGTGPVPNAIESIKEQTKRFKEYLSDDKTVEALTCLEEIFRENSMPLDVRSKRKNTWVDIFLRSDNQT